MLAPRITLVTPGCMAGLPPDSDTIKGWPADKARTSFSTPSVVIARQTMAMRSSVGVEFQIMMPVVNAPFRLYWAYNPQYVREFIVPPVVADRSMFPNETSYIRSISQVGQAYPFYEKNRLWRFTISRTF